MEDYSDDHDERILAHTPANWPGRRLIDLDNVGDPGFWLAVRMDYIREWLEDCDDDGDDLKVPAQMLAEDYIETCAGLGVPLPIDFADDEDFDAAEVWQLQDFTNEFAAMLRAWRDRLRKVQ